jgi:tetratricopeptide (TPR) repeat protein
MQKQKANSNAIFVESTRIKSTTALEIALLNLSGLGLGYLYVKQWKRWAIHFGGTLILLIVATLLKASETPWLWILIWLVWIGGMVFDGWRLGSREQPDKSNLIKSSLLSAAGIAFIFLFWGSSRFVCNRTFDAGLTAFTNDDYRIALPKFDLVSNLFQLTFLPAIPESEEFRTQCALMIFAQNSMDESRYEDAINSYTSLINLHPQSEKVSSARTQLPIVYHQWAYDLSQKKAYPEADQIYMILLNQYSDSTETEAAKAEIGYMYIAWAQTLRQTGDFKQAIARYFTVQKDYHAYVSVIDLQEEMAKTYVEWADTLTKSEDFSSAYDKYEIVIRQYADSSIAKAAYEKSAASLFTWGEQLYNKGDYESASEILEKVRDFYPGSEAIEFTNRILPDAMLKFTTELNDKGDFRRLAETILILIEEYPDSEESAQARERLSPALVAWGQDLVVDNRFLLAMEKTLLAQQEALTAGALETAKKEYQVALIALANDTGIDGQSVIKRAKANACAGEKTSVPGINLFPNQPGSLALCSGFISLPDDLEPTIPGTFRYVIEVEHNTKDIQFCPYSSGSLMKFLHRQQQQAIITVRSTLTGQVVFKQTFTGSTPEKCPATRVFSGLVEYEKGGPVSIERIVEWLYEILGQ